MDNIEFGYEMGVDRYRKKYDLCLNYVLQINSNSLFSISVKIKYRIQISNFK